MVDDIVGRIEEAIRPRGAQIPGVQTIRRCHIDRIGHAVAITICPRKLDHRTHGRCGRRAPRPGPVQICPVVKGVAVGVSQRPVRVRHRRAADPRPRPLHSLIRHPDPDVSEASEGLLQPGLLRRVIDSDQMSAQGQRLGLRGGPRHVAVGDPIVVSAVAPHPRVDGVHRGRVHVLTDADRERVDGLRRGSAVRR